MGRKVTTDYFKMGFVLVDVKKGAVTKKLPKCLHCETVFKNLCKIRLRQHSEKCNPQDSMNESSNDTQRNETHSMTAGCIDEESMRQLRLNKKQSNLNIFFENLEMNEKEIEEIKIALAEFFYANNIAFRTVENTYFKRLIKLLRPEFLKYLPNRKMLSSELLEKVHTKCVAEDKAKIRKESVLLVDGWTNSVTQTEWTTSIIHNSDGSTAFVTAEELDVKDTVGLSKAVSNAMEVSKELYETIVYAFETDNAAAYVSTGGNMAHALWHFRCIAHTLNCLVHDLIIKSLEEKINKVQVFFKYNFRNDQKARNTAKVILPSRTRWCYHL